MKKCNTCKEVKPLVDFSPYKRSADGHAYECKKCVAKRVKEYYIKNRSKRVEANKKWNKENRNEYQKRYRQRQRDNQK